MCVHACVCVFMCEYVAEPRDETRYKVHPVARRVGYRSVNVLNVWQKVGMKLRYMHP